MRAIISLSVLFFLSSCAAADWPQFRGPNADGFAPDKNINKNWKSKPPKELWRISLGDDGYAGPSVAAGKLFILDHQGGETDVVRAVNVATGKDAWTFPYQDGGKTEYGCARSTPIFDNGKLYTLGRVGNLFCLDAQDGKKIWSCNLKADFQGQTGQWDYAASPLVDDNKLIVCPGGEASVLALDKNTGKEIWRCGKDLAGYATPVIATLGGKRQYLIFAGKSLMGVSPDGKLLWNFPWETSYDVNAAAPIAVKDFVFISSGYNHGCALVNPNNGKPVWTSKEIQAHFSSAVLSGGSIYGTGDPGNLVCLDPGTGKARWKHPGFEKGGLAGVDGVLIVMDGEHGDVVMVNMVPTGYQELGRIKPLDGRSWTAPIISDGKLFVRNKQALVCLDLK
jgi:outer membrane protein assembly factor BamB